MTLGICEAQPEVHHEWCHVFIQAFNLCMQERVYYVFNQV